jgi:DNA-binding CsgD family transcriptional regulator/PAS domain-containing protein
MPVSVRERLTDAVFKAALEPEAWGEVMRLMQIRFPSEAQTFYFLDMQPRQVRPIFLQGVEPRWVASFDSLYFAPDNPWIRMTKQLHRPGLVRTNERLERYLRDPGVLYRSSYYNEWMRPQKFKYTIGNTLMADERNVANITLLRSPDMATFSAREVREFESLSRQLMRALQISLKLERAEKVINSTHVFDGLPQGVALVDAQRKVLYANRAMEALLREAQGLREQRGILEASSPEGQGKLAAELRGAFEAGGSGGYEAAPFILRHEQKDILSVYAIPVTGELGRYLPAHSMVLVMASRCAHVEPMSCDELRRSYGLTHSEARLAQLVARGSGVHDCAKALGITYGTARVCMKSVFEKMEVHSQAQLVARSIAGSRTSP